MRCLNAPLGGSGSKFLWLQYLSLNTKKHKEGKPGEGQKMSEYADTVEFSTRNVI